MKALIDGEEWVPVQGYEGLYEVSNMGRVRAPEKRNIVRGRHPTPYLRTRKPKVLALTGDKYLTVGLHRDGKCKRVLVHRLVAQHFVPNPDNLPEVNHLDEDKKNNKSTNLEWTTRSGNALHSSYKNRGSQTGTSKLSEAEVLEIVELLSKGHRQTEVAKLYGVTNHCVFRIQAGHNWAWLTGLGKEGSGRACID